MANITSQGLSAR